MLANLTGWHALIVLAVVVLLFGATKLPALAKSVGESMKIFKNEIKTTPAPQPAETIASPVTVPSATAPASTVSQSTPADHNPTV